MLRARFFTTSCRWFKQKPPTRLPWPPKPVKPGNTAIKAAEAPSNPTSGQITVSTATVAHTAISKAASTPAPTPKPVASSKPLPFLPPDGIPATYAERLASRGRTLLYEAPSHFWFRAGCFSSGAFCASYTVYQYWTVILHPPEGLLWWVPHAFGVILVFMSGMAAYFIMGTGRIVRTIEAVPWRQVFGEGVPKKKPWMSKAVKKSLQTTSPQEGAKKVLVEVATRGMIPFWPAKKRLYLPEEIQLPMRMNSVYGSGAIGGAGPQNNEYLSLAERVRRERALREAREAERKYNMDHILTAPFRDARKVFRGMFKGIRRSFDREGFVKIKLGDEKYKLDVTGGWALDEGRAMDRLLAVRPNALR
ncbi:uncharacterized protein CTHT_0025040 [Thermochaetoides thermophila DSM 1495]|uniref:Uncharacterized protein n=1 Tax=Chaetomium thermophilum (strain DSM 1495 / CBS 144.50 / IMI 039719) TaxID=759272 RepID=G0S5P9_CHATD|nr:hypothetical protein CTHT_0025040 [Thermochaetoides thermophila DSM 1495]EGS20668.1 hypothetical protein CTHT_0025040 [Thermochaetoides thermophila DSM 1495]